MATAGKTCRWCNSALTGGRKDRLYCNKACSLAYRNRKWRKAHPEKVREWQQKYYQKYRERRLRDIRRYYRENREKLLAQCREEAKRNPPGYSAAKYRQWKANCPGSFQKHLDAKKERRHFQQELRLIAALTAIAEKVAGVSHEPKP